MRLSKLTDKAATIFFWVAGLSIIVILAWFLIQILGGGLSHLSWSFITGKPSESIAGGGVGPQLFNSFYILFLSLLVSLPIGIGAGIYMAIYAGKNKFTDLIRISVEALSSVPSIVLGLFGALLFVNIMGWSFSIQAGAATLALLNLPILVRITEESIRAVPSSYWEASLALGSTQWQAIRKVLIPTAMPGLITGITLVSGRALGETAILIYTAGTSVARHSPFDLQNMGETLAVHLWYVGGSSLAPDAAEIAKGSAALLIIVVLVFNLFIALPSRMIQKRLSGGK
ncbi:phosphate ABC transporter permease PstA [Paenibacillus psychroresistens]|uniref:Phosphate transport system permease protein PstA n=1 Tax=Paenibacillus psychroresistens TaxID=1778678 RepID=A0A6B8RP51_9BACL|nr:phosphate ABC transporter permease PstA [Paenibacillus psychroresistens]QGQ97584.1 phosphate ABC transporter permease PstA [Paenibacillus psychroresistens]